MHCSLFLTWVTFSVTLASLSAATPRVCLLSSGLDPASATAFLEKLPGAQIVTAIGEAHHSQVLLLGEAGDESALKRMLNQARHHGLEVVWFPPSAASAAEEALNKIAADVMKAEGVMTVDFNAFSRSLLPKDAPIDATFDAKARHRQGEFLAEAVQQWWAACAMTNPETRHEKLWSDKAPAYQYAGPERVNRSGRIDRVSEPEIVRFLPKKRDRAPAVIFFPGGGYGYIGFLRNAKELADRLDPLGIAVIGLKYRPSRSRDMPLLDAERAVRYVREHAVEWGIDPERVGVAGQSAGANLVLTLAGNYDAGDAASVDPVERWSSRPDFMIVLTSWHYGENVSPFTFPSDLPPVFLRHARNDSSFKLAEHIVAQLQEAKAPLDYRFVDKGGHGAFELFPGNPHADWPDDFVSWLNAQGMFPEKRS